MINEGMIEEVRCRSEAVPRLLSTEVTEGMATVDTEEKASYPYPYRPISLISH